MKHKILISIHGGTIQAISTNGETEVHVMDWDNIETGASPEDTLFPHDEHTCEEFDKILEREKKKTSWLDDGEVPGTEPPRQWEVEFGAEFAVPEVLANHPLFSDQSWHNDVAPSFSPIKDGKPWHRVVLWSHHPVDEQRECPGDTRFVVSWYENDGSWIEEICCTNDIEKAIKAALGKAGIQ